jgi:hypothetical protein
MRVAKQVAMLIAMLTAVTILTGCASAPLGTDPACLVFEPICASRADTEDTIKQIIGHNAAYEAMCGIEVDC